MPETARAKKPGVGRGFIDKTIMTHKESAALVSRTQQALFSCRIDIITKSPNAYASSPSSPCFTSLLSALGAIAVPAAAGISRPGLVLRTSDLFGEGPCVSLWIC